MMSIQRVVATGLIALSLTACGGSSVEPPDVKLNPAPESRYEITLILDGSPAFASIEGNADFGIANEECMPLKDRIAGIKPKSWFIHPFNFYRKDRFSYVGHIYSDWLVDENYYGLGECRWELTSVQALVKIATVKQSITISGKQVKDQGSQLNLCRLPRNDRPWDFCSTPHDKKLITNEASLSYRATLTAGKVSQ